MLSRPGTVRARRCRRQQRRCETGGRRGKEPDDAYRDAYTLLEAEDNPPYAHAVVDETQDFGPQALKLIRALVPQGPNDLMFVGDGHQRIYAKNKATMSSCGIDIRGRAKKLFLNYRTTEEIRREAVSLLENVDVDDLDGGSDEIARYKSLLHGPVPEHIRGASMEVVRDGVAEFIACCLEEQVDAKVGVMAPTGKLRDQLAKQIREAGDWWRRAARMRRTAVAWGTIGSKMAAWRSWRASMRRGDVGRCNDQMRARGRR